MSKVAPHPPCTHRASTIPFLSAVLRSSLPLLSTTRSWHNASCRHISTGKQRGTCTNRLNQPLTLHSGERREPAFRRSHRQRRSLSPPFPCAPSLLWLLECRYLSVLVCSMSLDFSPFWSVPCFDPFLPTRTLPSFLPRCHSFSGFADVKMTIGSQELKTTVKKGSDPL